MTFKKKLPIMLLVLTALITTLSACGKNTDSNVNTASSEGAPAGTSAKDGEFVFSGLCFACHGADGKGVDGLGKDLTISDFVLDATDEELVIFIKEGRSVNDAANTTGVEMPPNGGNPGLTDEDLYSVVLYIRELSGN
jgi:cytochrome c5